MRISGRCLGGRGRVGVMAVLGQGQRAQAGQGDEQRRALQGSVLERCVPHAWILTSRIIPASMW